MCQEPRSHPLWLLSGALSTNPEQAGGRGPQPQTPVQPPVPPSSHGPLWRRAARAWPCPHPLGGPHRALSWQIREADGPAPGKDRAPEPRGLSLLVQQVLGRPLDKAQQLSNWDRRPLAEGQLLYAGTCPARPALPPGPLREAKAAPAPSCRRLLPAGGVLGAVQRARPRPPGGGPGPEPGAARPAGGRRPAPAGDRRRGPSGAWVLVRVEARGGGARVGGPGFLHPERSPECGQFPGGIPALPTPGLGVPGPQKSRAASGCACAP